ncbi:hypothetical protein ACFTUC_30245, partial [Streptomyces sp. NPDC056944]|uniref:hypothetical protein n=1 Tax=Streptomyces sp. NPDC056944 TaxID=3345972 RepID=UPI0036404112
MISREGRAVRQSLVVGGPGDLVLEQLEQAGVPEAVGAEQRAERYAGFGEPAGEVQCGGRCLGLGDVAAVLQGVEEGGDVLLHGGDVTKDPAARLSGRR